MRTLKVDDNNDLFVGQNGSMVLLTGIDAVMQDCEHYSKSQKGEMYFQTQLGVNTFGTVFEQVNLMEFKESLLENIERVPDVLSVPKLNVSKVGDTVEYTAQIQTPYGIETLNA